MKNKAAKIEEGIRLAWDSLESHLPYLDGKDAKFHLEAAKQYNRIIQIYLELY